VISGKVWKYKDNINTDIISPPAYMELKMKDAAKYAMSTIDTDFASQYKPGDIFVAENNLGSGSSRETAPLTLYELGLRTIVAKSYARIFYRNCINVGILAIECSETDKISKDDIIEIDYKAGVIVNKTKNETYACDKIPPHIMEIVNCGGLLNYLAQK
jgi:3-isopropylmalate/(R)-2-methylmalate dehydratase small subunit